MKILKNYIIFAIVIILIIITAFILINSGTNNTKKEAQQTSSNSIKNKENIVPDGTVGIISHKYTGYGQIEVIIKNNTGKDLKQVKITAHCWDKNGNNIGDTSNGQYNVNTTDTYKITLFCKSDMYKYKLELSY